MQERTHGISVLFRAKLVRYELLSLCGKKLSKYCNFDQILRICTHTLLRIRAKFGMECTFDIFYHAKLIGGIHHLFGAKKCKFDQISFLEAAVPTAFSHQVQI